MQSQSINPTLSFHHGWYVSFFVVLSLKLCLSFSYLFAYKDCSRNEIFNVKDGVTEWMLNAILIITRDPNVPLL